MASRTKKKAKRKAAGVKPVTPKKRAPLGSKARTRVQQTKRAKTKPKSKTRKSQHAASHSPRKKPGPAKGSRKGRKAAPRRISASVAERFAQGAQAAYVAQNLAYGRDSEHGDRYKFYSPTEILVRRGLAADIYRREQEGLPVSEAEAEWFDGYAVPSGRVAKHYSRLRWIDHGFGGKIRQRLVDAYEEGGDEALADYASRAAHELQVPLREVYTLFWSG